MQKDSILVKRYLENDLKKLLKKGFSALLLGPRQTGKTTLIKEVLRSEKNRVEIYLQNPEERQDMERDPGRLIRELRLRDDKPYVFIDEAQKAPEVFDSAQLLIDEGRARFILSGSSARKLRRGGINLIPGRIKRYNLDPLSWGELGFIGRGTIRELAVKNINPNRGYGFGDALVFGSLPGLIKYAPGDRAEILEAYARIYLEEEIRAEAVSRRIGAFSRFLELAAIESGTSPNLSKLSNESGASVPTIKEFYRILADTLVAEKVEPYLKNARKRILSSPRYYFFDLGVRNSLARLPLDPKLINAQKGQLFEHAVVLEVIRRIRILGRNYKINFWRTAAGAEVDLVIDTGEKLIPIEIRAGRRVGPGELTGLRQFLSDYKKQAEHGYVVFNGAQNQKLAENITAVPWFNL